ncbi:hypothetical protein [Paracoccus rhizosphaerae]
MIQGQERRPPRGGVDRNLQAFGAAMQSVSRPSRGGVDRNFIRENSLDAYYVAPLAGAWIENG